MEAKFWVSSEFRLLLGTYRYVKFTFQSNLFENTDSTGRFTMYAWNVVLNVVLVEYSPSRIFDCMVCGQKTVNQLGIIEIKAKNEM